MKYLTHLLSLCGCAATLLFTSCSTDEDVSLFFLAQADGTEQGASFTIMYKDTPYERTPIFSINQIEKFSSFLNPDGSYGVVLYADSKYNSRLYSATASRLGKLILPVMNGLAFGRQRITQPIDTGKLAIRDGLNGYDLKLLSQKLKPVNEEIEKKRFLDTNPRKTPDFDPVKSQQSDQTGRAIPVIPSAR